MTDADRQLQDVDKLIGELETQFTVYDNDDPLELSVGDCTNGCTYVCTHGCTGKQCGGQ